MDLNHLHLVSPDLESSVDFYKTYFEFHKLQKLESGNYFIYNREGFMIAIVKCDAKPLLPEWYHHGFRLRSVEQVEELYGRFRRDGVEIAQELEKFDDFVVFRCKDPAGFPVEVYWSPGPIELRV